MAHLTPARRDALAVIVTGWRAGKPATYGNTDAERWLLKHAYARRPYGRADVVEPTNPGVDLHEQEVSSCE